MILLNKNMILRPLGRQSNFQVLDNEFVHCIIATPEKGQQPEQLLIDDIPEQKVSVPLSFWQAHKEQLLARDHEVAVQLGAADFAEDIASDLEKISTIVLPFESAVDGRSYTHAYLLRTRFNFAGEIRAIGDVHMDQLNFLARCGCDAFELPDEEDSAKASQAFELFPEVYQPSADGGDLIFARRRATH